jgi:hypothetical protein
MPITSTAACHGPVPWTSRGRSGARWGDHLDAAPRSAWPGRVMIAKLVDPYAAAVNEVSLGKIGRPSVGFSGPCISSHRTRVRKASQ